jgi:hypothetical protein
MITRMPLPLKRASAEGPGRGWDVDENECALDPPTTIPRILRGFTRFPRSVCCDQVDNDTSIPMETIHTWDEKHYI